MKKILLIALALAVGFCLPLTAQAKTEFELGGYIRLDAVWTSQNSQSHAFTSYCVRPNAFNNNHGKFQMNANATRFNFTIKGPEVWGGKVVGFIEVDFDGFDPTIGNVSYSSFNQAKLRLRHAMFKINWPDREVLFGQYWSVNSELIPETADSGGYAVYGATQLRLPQVRYTQKFTDSFNASLAICSPQNGRWGLNVDNSGFAPNEAETSETPMVEAKVRFEQDLYGKAAWYGKPRGFYVGAGAGYFRSRNIRANSGINVWQTWATNNFQNITNNVTTANPRYQDHWLFLIENFTPIIPTVSKSLGGTLGLAHQWWIGQGVSAWRLAYPTFDRYYTYDNVVANTAGVNALGYNMQLIKMYGGWAQLQYYWTNEIYTNINFGFSKAFGGPSYDRNTFLNGLQPATAGFEYGTPGFDPVQSTWRTGITQWYRPVAAVKFAVQYNYMRTNYFQYTTVNSTRSRYGENHSLMANAWYMF